MKTISTGGVTFIELVPGGTSEWYYGSSLTHGDLYEAEELFRDDMHIDAEIVSSALADTDMAALVGPKKRPVGFVA